MQQLEVGRGRSRSRTASSLPWLRPASAQRRPGGRVAGEVVSGELTGEAGGAEEDDVEVAISHAPILTGRGTTQRGVASDRREIRTAIVSATTVALAVGSRRRDRLRPRPGRRTRTTGAAPPTPRAPAPGTFVLANASLRLAPDCDSLLESYVDRGLDLVTAYGWGGGGIVMFDAQSSDAAGAAEGVHRDGPGPDHGPLDQQRDRHQRAGGRRRRARRREGGGRASCSASRTTCSRPTTSPATSREQLSSLQLPDLRNGEILVSGDRVVVLGDLGEAQLRDDRRAHRRRSTRASPGPRRSSSRPTTTATISAGSPARRRRPASCSTTACRQLDFRYPDGSFGERERARPQPAARPRHHAGRLAADRATASPSSDCDDVALPTMETALGTTTWSRFEPAVVEPTTTAVATTRHDVLLLPRPLLPRRQRLAVRLVGRDRPDDRLHRPLRAERPQRHRRQHGAVRLRPRRHRHDVRRLRRPSRGRSRTAGRWTTPTARCGWRSARPTRPATSTPW